MDIDNAFFNSADYELIQKQAFEAGSFGKVYLVKNIIDDQIYAAKILNIDEGFDGNCQMMFLRESLILHKLNHPAIVKFKGINFQKFNNHDLTNELQPTIITEYISNGSLRKQIDLEKNSRADARYTPTAKYHILLGIADAMRYLHEKKIIHRDLKPENILIDDNFKPVICDFGLSRCFPESLKKTMTGLIGTPLYMAPELLIGNTYDSKVEVFSFGVLAYEIVTGNTPNEVLIGKRPSFTKGMVSKKIKKLISRCWDENPKVRPTFKEIFNILKKEKSFDSNQTFETSTIDEYINLLEDLRTEEKAENSIQLSNNSENINSGKINEIYLYIFLAAFVFLVLMLNIQFVLLFNNDSSHNFHSIAYNDILAGIKYNYPGQIEFIYPKQTDFNYLKQIECICPKCPEQTECICPKCPEQTECICPKCPAQIPKKETSEVLSFPNENLITAFGFLLGNKKRRNPNLAMHILQKLAEKGSIEASFLFGLLNENENGDFNITEDYYMRL